MRIETGNAKPMYGPASDLTFAPFYREDMEAEYANMQGAFEKWA